MNRRLFAPALLLVALTAFATSFALFNSTNTVRVWPLMRYQSLTLVIAVAFCSGAGVSALVSLLLYHYRAQASPPTESNALSRP